MAALFKQKKKEKPASVANQKALIATVSSPGRNCDLIISTDLATEKIDVRSSQVLDTDAGSGALILSQTFPAVLPSMAGKEIEVTYLLRLKGRPGGTWIRVGYQAKILQILRDYKVDNTLTEDVIFVPPPKELERKTLRLHYRLSPPVEMGVSLSVMPENAQVVISDISAGGVSFLHGSALSFSLGSTVEMMLSAKDAGIQLKGKVVRSGQGPMPGQTLTAAHFVETKPADQRRLSRLMNDMARARLAKRSGVDSKAPKR